ncbi:HesB/YadR/YfhF family protein [Bacillus sp. FJAT-27445]|uniref:HesB/YadR/YfhF family protein n=1 Tax=Bacillus sp. FJAT-27445 TaxID=1679166 RepID=UPI000743E66D|nr:hypothetical protein [Bacillus sp. FJAT-27445]
MYLSFDKKALSWFANEFGIKEPISIRLHPQYDGFGLQHKGFSLALSAEPPTDPCYLRELNGVTFYVEASDSWFFEKTNTFFFYDESIEELAIRYEEEAA